MHYSGLNTPSEWTLAKVLESQAARLDNRPAIEFVDGGKWSYRDCLINGQHGASLLQNQGVHQRSNVVVMVNDPDHFCRLWFALSLIGGVMVAINTGLKGQVLQHQLENAQADLIVCDSLTLPAVEQAQQAIHSSSPRILSAALFDHTAPQFDDKDHRSPSSGKTIKPADVACIMYTSGTSGPSKGVLMPEAHCFMFALGTIENLGLMATDVFYICLPLFHANGLFMQLYPSLVAGAKAVIRPRFSASSWLTDIRHSGATHTNLLGATAAFVVAQPPTDHDLDHQLRVITAAPLPVEPEKIFRNRFGVGNVLPLYGMTEVNIPLYGKLGESAPGTCGKVYEDWFEVEIRDPETDLPLINSTIGEIMVRPKHPFCFMSGYADMPEKTVEAWRNFWFHTGDAGYRRDDGYFVFVDRIKDSIRRRGENISSYEVEQAVMSIDGVTEVAAYAVPAGGDGMEDEVMIAVMVPSGHHLNPKDIHQVALQSLPGFAVPRYIRMVEDLPKTATGKVRKVVLKTQGVTDDCWDALHKPD